MLSNAEIIRKRPKTFTNIGGQAVIEGVMMRSPHYIATAVRKADQSIVIRSQSYESRGLRNSFYRKPLIRGVVSLVESMIQGIEALGYSAQVSSDGDKDDGGLTRGAIFVSILMAFVFGIGLFVALPHLLTYLILSFNNQSTSADSPFFHLLDGVLKMAILMAYIWLISRMNDIRRVFQYHGAEHKSIYAFEYGKPLTPEYAQKFTTLHPRCGTSFLLFLVLISIGMFSIIFPLVSLDRLTGNPILNHLSMVVMKVILMFPVAGLAYEFIKACAFRMDSAIFRGLIWPGMKLQRLTTREPDDSQLEVALASLIQVLRLEQGSVKLTGNEPEEIKINQISDLDFSGAQVTDFQEE